MKRPTILAAMLAAVAGCHPAESPISPPKTDEANIAVRVGHTLGNGSHILSVEHKGKRHVFLVYTEVNGVAMERIGEYPIGDKP